MYMISNRLRFDMKLLNQPEPNSGLAKYQIWGEFQILLLTPLSTDKLFNWEGDLGELIDWLIYAQSGLCCDEFPQMPSIEPPYPGESLSQAMERAYSSTADYEEHDEETQDRWLDNIHEPLRLYRDKHLLRRALRGYSVPPLLIGLNHGRGEISLSTKKEDNPSGENWDLSYTGDWAYSFDMNDFCSDLHQTASGLVSEWRTVNSNAEAQRVADKLLGRIKSNNRSC